MKLDHDIPLKFFFCLQFKVMDPCFIPIDNLWQKAFTISLLMEEQIWTHTFLHSSVIDSVRLLGTQQAHSFAYPKETVMLFTLLLDTGSSISRFLAVICQSFWMSLSAQWSNAECWNWCAFDNKNLSNSWLLMVRIQREFTDICSKCVLKQSLEMGTIQQWVCWIMKLIQNFMTFCRVITAALQ